MHHTLFSLSITIACLLSSFLAAADERPSLFQNSTYRVEFTSSYRKTVGFYGLKLGDYSLAGAFDLHLPAYRTHSNKKYSLKKTDDYQSVKQGDNLLLSAKRVLTENGGNGEAIAKVEQKMLFAADKISVSFMIVPEQDIPLNRYAKSAFSVYNGSDLTEYLGKTIEAFLPDNSVKSLVIRNQENFDRKHWLNRDLFKQVRVVDAKGSLFFIAEGGSLINVNCYETGIEFYATLPIDNPDSRPFALQKGHVFHLDYSIMFQP